MIEDKNFFMHMLDVFLDTTPRQWIGKVKRLFLFNPVLIIRNIKFNFKSITSFSLYGSLIFHGALALALGIDVGQIIEENFTEEGRAKVAQQKQKKREQLRQKQELVEITGIYYISPEDLYTKKKSRRNVNKKVSKLSSFLNSIQGDDSSEGAATGNTEGFQVSSVNTVNEGTRQVRGNTKVQGWEKELNVEKKQIRFDDIEGELNKHLAQYNGQFRGCYEKVLLTDQSLNANIKFLLKVGGNRNISQARIDFAGSGKPESKKQLENCLLKIAKTIQLPQKSIKLKGKQLKFYVVLNSWK